MILLQVPGSLWSTTGSVTGVGVLLVFIALLLLGYLSPKHVVAELREENSELRIELAVVNGKYVEQVKINAGLEARLEGVERELARLRGKLGEGA